MRDAAVAELKRILEDALHTYKGHFEAAWPWKRGHTLLGVFATLGSAAAATIALTAQAPVPTAIVAFAAAGIGSVMTALDPGKKAADHDVAGTNYQALHREVRLVLTVQAAEMPMEALIGQLRQFQRDQDRLNKLSPRVPRRAYRKAKKGIQDGEATHEVDRHAVGSDSVAG